MTPTRSAAILVLALALAACSGSNSRNEAEPAANEQLAVGNDADDGAATNTMAEPPKSILRPEIVEPEPETPPLRPLDLTIPFGNSGTTLDEAGRQALDTMLASSSVAAGGPITLSGHSDSRGTDRANLLSSRKRAEAVRAYLLGKGVSPDRITVIALGETRPLAPNAHPDGSDDPDARARNQRVEVAVALPPAPASDEAQPAPDPTPRPKG